MTVMTAGFLLQQETSVKIPERVDKSAQSNVISAESDTNTASGEEKGVTNGKGAAVHYKPSRDRKSQVQQHVSVRQNKTTEHIAD